MQDVMTGDADKLAHVELSFRPNVELISVVRRFVAEFHARMFSDPDTTSRIALASHELLENAIRYSLDGETRIRIEVLRESPMSHVKIRTWNRATPEHLNEVRKLFGEMRENDDPFHHYQALMRRTARIVGGSGLGLARVRAEGEMQLAFSEEKGVLVVTAVTTANLSS
jgi:anti-sigma regulatory factor (Ser/Thr protein kinase)